MSSLPNGWVETPLLEDVKYKKGKKPKKLVESLTKGLVPYIDIKAFEKGIIRKYANSDDGVNATTNETLMVWDGARSGLIGRGVDGVIGSTLMKITPVASSSDYLHYFLHSKFGEINSKTKGTGIPHVDPQVLWRFPYPIAPLNEQTRIANKLDSLLAKVDATKIRLDKIPTILKRFRQSVLAVATSGELTKEWRGNNTFGDVVSIEELIDDIRYGTSKKCEYQTDGTPVLRIPNMGERGINLVDLKYAKFEAKEIKNLSLKKGDLLIIRSNGSVGLVGRVNIVTEKVMNCLFAGYLIRIRFKNINKTVPKYILYFLQSPKIRETIEINARSTSGINNINSKEIGALEVILPDPKEQKEIVRRVDELFSLADVVEKQYQAAISRLDKLTQSILAKAFRGELVPQDPNDESAEKLLERIQSLREQEKLKQPKKKIAKKKATTK